MSESVAHRGQFAVAFSSPWIVLSGVTETDSSMLKRVKSHQNASERKSGNWLTNQLKWKTS